MSWSSQQVGWKEKVALLTALLSVGCEGPTNRSGVYLRNLQAVLGGTASSNESVVMVIGSGEDTSSLCTGTLIAPRLVLTARHCVSRYTAGDYTCTIQGNLDLSRPRAPANAGEMGAVFAGSSVAIHVGAFPDFNEPSVVGSQVLAPETDQICRNDIALVILNEALDLPVAKLRLDRGLQYGEQVTVVGYGLNEGKTTQRRERSGLIVLGVGPSEFFDREGQALPRTFVLGSGVCPGDSGGPALSTESNEILGVFSLFRGDCESPEARNFYTQIAAFEQLLRDGFEAAGSDFPDDPDDPDDAENPGEIEAGGHGGTGPDPSQNQGGASGAPESPSSQGEYMGCSITALGRAATSPIGEYHSIVLLIGFLSRVIVRARTRWMR